jgi:hypothetical protein
MRARCLFLALTLAACGDNTRPADIGPGSMREQLAAETRLLVATGDSAGVITAQRKTDHGWAARLVDLQLDSGAIALRADGGGATVLALELWFRPVQIPSTLVGRDAELRNIRLRLAAPAPATMAWHADDDAELAARLELALSWSVTVDGAGLPLGAPELPAIPVAVQLTGDGAGIDAEVRIGGAGDLWSWADLVKLNDLQLVVRARTPAP